MGNNNNQKNVIYGEALLAKLAYQDARAATAGRTADGQSGPLMAETLNDHFAQLVDNDLYVERKLNQLSGGLPGPAAYDAVSMYSAPDGYKAWRIVSDSDLSVLRKVMDPVSSTMELTSLQGQRVSFVFGFGGKVFAGTNDGLYVQDPDGGFNAVAFNGQSQKCTGRCVAGGVAFVATEDAVYSVNIEGDDVDLVEVSDPDIQGIRSVYYKEDTGRLFVGTGSGIFCSKWSPSKPGEAEFESCQMVNSSWRVVSQPVNGFFQRKMRQGSENGDEVVAYTSGAAASLFSGTWSGTVVDGRMYSVGKCYQIMSMGAANYACAQNGLYSAADGKIVQMTNSLTGKKTNVTGPIVAATWAGNTIYAIKSDGTLYELGPSPTYAGKTYSTGVADASGLGAVTAKDRAGSSKTVLLISKGTSTYTFCTRDSSVDGSQSLPFTACGCDGGKTMYGWSAGQVSAMGSLSLRDEYSDTVVSLVECRHKYGNVSMAGKNVRQLVLDYMVLDDGIYRGGMKLVGYSSVAKAMPVGGDAKIAVLQGRNLKLLDGSLNETLPVTQNGMFFSLSAADAAGMSKNYVLAADGAKLSAVYKYGLIQAQGCAAYSAVKDIVHVQNASEDSSYVLGQDNVVRQVKEGVLLKDQSLGTGVLDFDGSVVDGSLFPPPAEPTPANPKDPPISSYYMTAYAKQSSVAVHLSCKVQEQEEDADQEDEHTYFKSVQCQIDQTGRGAVRAVRVEGANVTVCGAQGIDTYGIYGLSSNGSAMPLYEVDFVAGGNRLTALLESRMSFANVNSYIASPERLIATDTGLSTTANLIAKAGEFASGTDVKFSQIDSRSEAFTTLKDRTLTVYGVKSPEYVAGDSWSAFSAASKLRQLEADYVVHCAVGFNGKVVILAGNSSSHQLSAIYVWTASSGAIQSSVSLVAGNAVGVSQQLYNGLTHVNSSSVSAFVDCQDNSTKCAVFGSTGLVSFYPYYNAAGAASVPVSNQGRSGLIDVHVGEPPASSSAEWPRRTYFYFLQSGKLNVMEVQPGGLFQPFSGSPWTSGLKDVRAFVGYKPSGGDYVETLNFVALNGSGQVLSAECSTQERSFVRSGTMRSGVSYLAEDYFVTTASSGDRLFNFYNQKIVDQTVNSIAGAVVWREQSGYCATLANGKIGVYRPSQKLQKLLDGKFVKVEKNPGGGYLALAADGKMYNVSKSGSTFQCQLKTSGVSTFCINKSKVNAFFSDGTVARDVIFATGSRERYFDGAFPAGLKGVTGSLREVWETHTGINVGAAFVVPGGTSVDGKLRYELYGGKVDVVALTAANNSGLVAIAGDAKLFAAASKNVYRLDSVSGGKVFTLLGQLPASETGNISKLFAAGDVPYAKLSNGRIYCLMGGQLAMVPAASGLQVNCIQGYNGVHAFSTSDGLKKPQYQLRRRLAYSTLAKEPVAATSVRMYGGYDRQTAALVAKDGHGERAYFALYDSASGYFEVSQAVAKVEDADVGQFEAAFPVWSEYWKVVFFLGGMLYVYDMGRALEYPDGRLVGRAAQAFSAGADGHRTYVGMNDGLYSSKGAGQAYVFRQAKVLGSMDSYQHVGDGNGKYLLATSKGIWIVAGLSPDLALDTYKAAADESPVTYVGEWRPYWSLSACAAFGKSLAVSGNFRKWQTILNVGNGQTILGAYARNSYQYYIATDAGLWTTRMSYKLSNDMERFTLDKAYKIFTDQRPAFKAEYDRSLAEHADEWHYSGDSTLVARNIVPLLNESYLSVDFGGLSVDKFGVKTAFSGGLAVSNDIVYEYEFGDQDDGEVHVRAQNFAVSADNMDCSYILRRYVSGVSELYVYVPTTNTYYLGHNAGTPNCLYGNRAMKRQNLTQFGLSVQTTGSELSSHYTTFELAVEDTLISVQNLLDVQVEGCSLPLKVYRDYDNAEAEDGACLMYHSFVEPSQYVTDMVVPPRDEQGDYVFRFACFGTDAQSVRIMCYDPVNGTGSKTFKVKYNPNGAGGKMPTQRFYVGVPKRLRPCAYSWPEGEGKIFYGWTTKPMPDDNEIDGLPDRWPDGATFQMDESQVKPGQVVNLYAIWMVYRFGDQDTQILLQSPSTTAETYLKEGAVTEIDGLGQLAVIDYGAAGGGSGEIRVVSQINRSTTSKKYND